MLDATSQKARLCFTFGTKYEVMHQKLWKYITQSSMKNIDISCTKFDYNISITSSKFQPLLLNFNSSPIVCINTPTCFNMMILWAICENTPFRLYIHENTLNFLKMINNNPLPMLSMNMHIQCICVFVRAPIAPQICFDRMEFG